MHHFYGCECTTVYLWKCGECTTFTSGNVVNAPLCQGRHAPLCQGRHAPLLLSHGVQSAHIYSPTECSPLTFWSGCTTFLLRNASLFNTFLSEMLDPRQNVTGFSSKNVIFRFTSLKIGRFSSILPKFTEKCLFSAKKRYLQFWLKSVKVASRARGLDHFRNMKNSTFDTFFVGYGKAKVAFCQ